MHTEPLFWLTSKYSRLSTGLGLPPGVDGRQLRAELPRPFSGYQHPLPMIINLRIAQMTGEIMTCEFVGFVLDRKRSDVYSVLWKHDHHTDRACNEDSRHSSQSLRDRTFHTEFVVHGFL
jgi:hypothetical protein